MNGINLWGLLVQIIVGIIIVAPVLWLVGRSMVGKEKAKFTDAIWIVALGIIIQTLLKAVVGSLGFFVGLIVTLIIWLALIRHFFDTGWLKAFLIGIVALVVFIIISLILMGLGIIAGYAVMQGLLS